MEGGMEGTVEKSAGVKLWPSRGQHSITAAAAGQQLLYTVNTARPRMQCGHFCRINHDKTSIDRYQFIA